MAVADILVTPAKVYFAAYGTAYPDETTIAYNEAWGGSWTDMGYTLEPVGVGYNQETFELEVQQITNPVSRTIVKEEVMFETVLAEFTETVVELAFNATGTAYAAGAAQVGYTEWKMGGKTDLDVYTFGLEGLYKDSANNEFPVRIFLPRATATLNGQLTFAKNAGAGIPIQIKALADTTLASGEQIMVIQKVTAAATTT